MINRNIFLKHYQLISTYLSKNKSTIENKLDGITTIRKHIINFALLAMIFIIGAILFIEIFIKHPLSINHIYITNKAVLDAMPESLIINGIYNHLTFHTSNKEYRDSVYCPKIKMPRVDKNIIETPAQVTLGSIDFGNMFTTSPGSMSKPDTIANSNVDLNFNIPGSSITFESLIHILRHYLHRDRINIYGYLYSNNYKNYIKLYGSNNFISSMVYLDPNNIDRTFDQLSEEIYMHYDIDNAVAYFTNFRLSKEERFDENMKKYKSKLLYNIKHNINREKSLSLLAMLYSYNEEFDKALDLFINNKEALHGLNDYFALIYYHEALHQYINTTYYYNNYDACIKSFTIAAHLCNNQLPNNNQLLFNCYYLIGDLYVMKKDLDKALENFKTALDYSRQLNKDTYYSVNLKIGTIYLRDKNDLKGAITYFEKAYTSNKTYNLAKYYMSAAYAKNSEIEKSLHYFKEIDPAKKNKYINFAYAHSNDFYDKAKNKSYLNEISAIQ